MPKTPESGGIPLPHTWPPFTRSTWDARAQSLLTSLGRMGHENEGYAFHEAAVYLDPESHRREGGGGGSDRHAAEQAEYDEVEPTRLLHTFAQRRAFVVKSMDLHRHTIGGGRSGRRGRAECVAFLRRVIEMLDEQKEEAEALLGVDVDGGVVGSEFGEGELLSSSEEEEEETEDEDEDEEEAGDDEAEADADADAVVETKAETETPNSPKDESPNAPTTTTTVKTTPSSKKVNTRTVILNEEDFFDQHNDLCEVCNLPGELLCCATCNLVFHTKCARPKLVKEPDDDWKCAYCIAEGSTGGKKEGRERKKALQACREMEKTRRELKEQKGHSLPADEDGNKSSDNKADEPSPEVAEEDSGYKEENRKGEAEEESNVKSEDDRAVSPVAEASPKSVKLDEATRVQSEESLKVKASSRSSTPCRELEDLTAVPKHLQVDEHEVLYSITGRIQRNRKKPTIYDPKTGPDSDWKSERITEKSAEAAKTKTPDNAGAFNHDTTAPKKRGPKPGKKKKKPKKPPKKPLKKKILPDTEGVGVLNRLPGTLFDCSVCLDITKIKLCCYCACRVCFNKFGKEQTILCDKCDQEYHTFCLTPPMKKLPEEEVEWLCPACIDDEKKKKSADARKVAAAAKKAEEDRKKAEFEDKRQIQVDKRKSASEAKKAAATDAKKKVTEDMARIEALQPKSAEISTLTPPLKKSPGRPRSTPPAPTSVASSTSNVPPTNDDQPPKKRGRGRPRKDGRDPIPRQVQTVQPHPIPVDLDDTNVERSRSGRKIHRTIFHDEVNGGRGNKPDAKRPKKGSPSETVGTSEVLETTQATSFSSSGFLERSAAAAAKSAIAGATKVGPRRKPGARECMQMSRKFGANVIEQKYFDVLMDYSKRGKVDHLIRMRERLDDHARFLESQLAGLEALVQEKEDINAAAELGDTKDV